MLKTFFLLLISLSLFGKGYRFSEIRYSDALDLEKKQNGIIEFLPNGVSVLYPESNTTISYIDADLLYTKNKKKIPLDAIQSAQIIQYFEILDMIHTHDKEQLKEMFFVKKLPNGNSVLFPKEELEEFISKIEIDQSKTVRIYMKNKDRITIKIDEKVQ